MLQALRAELESARQERAVLLQQAAALEQDLGLDVSNVGGQPPPTAAAVYPAQADAVGQLVSVGASGRAMLHL